MGEFTDKLKGTTDKAVGSIKETVGKATGNEDLEARGMAQKLKGQAEKAVGSVKGTINKI
ncbi:CsbD family protein [Gluconacetobacter entanii]|uniref:CsbD family protein n=1 Tax=Gluconacetobacter entanii TaxID=108528 RepID=A0A318PQZ2_9PROT|nr:CsbD family protein [Gluconacetobacter entanii]MCE2578792.1 CsbD family protein [Komagataeibacter sp. FNDCR1]MBY4641779.1 CsbD family protein [Gluconacetobacter entanii]MCW4581595.1 CsbD family protein [Gluconacetobacter entanii]MCW4584983.1 CsbD family protein [Gluconacetobacter entanii]MCW4588397.1 CsbD family protein [Gluconacetobacter entanii]